jgi:hypothetical protein
MKVALIQLPTVMVRQVRCRADDSLAFSRTASMSFLLPKSWRTQVILRWHRFPSDPPNSNQERDLRSCSRSGDSIVFEKTGGGHERQMCASAIPNLPVR